MKSTVETLSPTRVRLAIEVPFAELEPSLQEGVPGDRRSRSTSRASAGARCRPRSSTSGSAGQRSSTRRCRRRSRSRSSPRSASTRCKTLGRPEVEITEFADGAAAEVHRRGRRPAGDHAAGPEHASRSPSTRSRSPTRTIDEQVNGLRRAVRHAEDRRARPAQRGRLRADRPAPRPSTARRCRAARRRNLSHEVGSNQLLPGLDEALVGMSRRRRRPPSPRSWSAATSPAGTPRWR